MRGAVGYFLVAFLLVGCVLSIPSASAVPGWSASHGFDRNPGVQGESNRVHLQLTNSGDTTQWVKVLSVTFEWRSTPYTTSVASVPVSPGETKSFSVSFDVPLDVPTTTQRWSFTVDYDWQSGPTPSDRTSARYSSGDHTDFSVGPPSNLASVMVIAVLIVAAVIVLSVVILYMRRKPIVQVYQTQMEQREEPVTRIRPAGAPGRLGATVAATVGVPGLVLSLPGGATKTVPDELVLGRNDFVGSAPADAVAKISAQHLRIFRDGAGYMVEDGYQGRASTNGTWLNGKSIKGLGAQRLRGGDVLRLADLVEVSVKSPGPAGAPPPGATVAVPVPTQATGPMLTLQGSTGKPLSVSAGSVVGREDLKGIAPPDKLQAISGKHLTVLFEGGQFYVSDGHDGTPSTNGTSVNGVDIRGKGKVKLNAGDRIQIAGAVELRVVGW